MDKEQVLDVVEQVFIIENADLETRGDGSEGSEGTLDTEWGYNE